MPVSKGVQEEQGAEEVQQQQGVAQQAVIEAKRQEAQDFVVTTTTNGVNPDFIDGAPAMIDKAVQDVQEDTGQEIKLDVPPLEAKEIARHFTEVYQKTDEEMFKGRDRDKIPQAEKQQFEQKVLERTREKIVPIIGEQVTDPRLQDLLIKKMIADYNAKLQKHAIAQLPAVAKEEEPEYKQAKKEGRKPNVPKTDATLSYIAFLTPPGMDKSQVLQEACRDQPPAQQEMILDRANDNGFTLAETLRAAKALGLQDEESSMEMPMEEEGTPQGIMDAIAFSAQLRVIDTMNEMRKYEKTDEQYKKLYVKLEKILGEGEASRMEKHVKAEKNTLKGIIESFIKATDNLHSGNLGGAVPAKREA